MSCMWVRRRARRAIVSLFAIAALFPIGAGAQAPNIREEARRATAPRAELEAIASSMEQMASQPGAAASTRAKLAEARAIRDRLSTGDFQPGDRIVLRLTGDPTLQPVDTLVVRAGQSVVITGIGEVSLRGVLRAELADYMTREVKRFVRAATVTTTAVTRLALFGAFLRPGFYEYPSELLLSEVIMRSGGVNSLADQHKFGIWRGGAKLWGSEAVDAALQEGISVEQMGLRGGDELRVDESRQTNSQTVLQIFMMVFQVVNLAVLISRR